MNILCCLLCFNVVCRCYNWWGHTWTLGTEILINRIIHNSVWHISILANSDRRSREQLQSLLPQPAPEPVLRAQHARTAHKHARQGSFPEHTHARLRLSRALEKSGHWRLSGGVDCGETWLRGNLAASLMSQKNEKALRIICKIGLRNGERGERVAGDDDGWQ